MLRMASSSSLSSSSSAAQTPLSPPAAAAGMPPLIDSHCHLDILFEKIRYTGGSLAAFRAQPKWQWPPEVKGCITMFSDPAALSPSLSLFEVLLAEPNVWGAFGLHPHHAQHYNEQMEARICAGLQHPHCCALGETGLDYAHYSPSTADAQQHAFRQQMALAVAHDKPIVVHSRNADNDTFRLMSECLDRDFRIHLHCFQGSLDTTRRFLAHFSNLAVGFTGAIITSKNRNLLSLVEEVPLERMLLETDAPYMPAQGTRRALSHPGQVLAVAERVAQLKQVSLLDVLAGVATAVATVYPVVATGLTEL